ncbi:hypothetical protein AMTRI_Chr12g241360 [Amborella trichopoda]|uniref:Protein kinase domain-containing protein n=1 Tax=Amborella trichopoda TaxID=13333 RepID=W1PH96_AMBTC|nr:rust resistance kinase Lr10 [Amborella trichopoda]ERN07343.1 hypothetical protein AMTR_s00019p00230170 [Amborella trichopoda]|eukprot:XP_006845668.1 rust resistance kinase Lr10 [Amborella trichopoda]
MDPLPHPPSPDFFASMPIFAKVIFISMIVIVVVLLIYTCFRGYIAKTDKASVACTQDSRVQPLNIDEFLSDIEKLKPMMFTSQQLSSATSNFSYKLGAGGFGKVYKGTLSNGINVAVKVLEGRSDHRIEAQFMAEVSTIGRTHHVNLVRLIGFCFEESMTALVYEYMERGSLDKFLFTCKEKLGFDKLQKIAVGTAKAIAYLHEECQERIIHYDIKPGNILLDRSFSPKVADFGLAKLCNRDATHVTMTGGRGTPGYAAPELWMPFPITHKCDIYSYGMLLFEIVGRRRNLEMSFPESQEWLPRWVWEKFEKGEIEETLMSFEIGEENKEVAERMVLIALWCVQYKPELRPCMSNVVKMLEGGVEIFPPPNPFTHLIGGTSVMDSQQLKAITEEEPYSETTSTMKRFEIRVDS